MLPGRGGRYPPREPVIRLPGGYRLESFYLRGENSVGDRILLLWLTIT